jgi:hypothetical protein
MCLVVFSSDLYPSVAANRSRLHPHYKQVVASFCFAVQYWTCRQQHISTLMSRDSGKARGMDQKLRLGDDHTSHFVLMFDK